MEPGLKIKKTNTVGKGGEGGGYLTRGQEEEEWEAME